FCVVPAPLWRRLGWAALPVVTARTTFAGDRASIAFPNGHPECFVCGTCKRSRVLAHRAAGRRVVFIGDGESDRYAAGYSDIVFAKRLLERICLDAGWPFTRWNRFSAIQAWAAGAAGACEIDAALATALVACEAVPSSLVEVAPGAPPPHPFFCGPEVWGPGLSDPPE